MSGSGPKAGRRPPLGSVSLVSSDLQFLQDSLTGALSAHQPGKRLQGHGPQILAGAAADRDRAVFHIPVADHQHEGDFFQSGFPDFFADLLVAAVHLGPEALAVQLAQELLGSAASVGDRQNFYLHRSQPHRESAGEMLSDHADEAFDGA